MLAVEMANRESSTSWKEFLLGLKRRGLRGVVFAVSDITRSNAPSWRCSRRLIGNAVMCISCATRSITCPANRRRLLAGIALLYIGATPGSPPDLAACCCAGRKISQALRLVEENIEETLTFYRLPQNTTNILKYQHARALNQEIKRRTHVIRIFPNEESALRSFALAVEIHETDRSPPLPQHEMLRNNVSNFNSWRPPKVNSTASSQTVALLGVSARALSLPRCRNLALQRL